MSRQVEGRDYSKYTGRPIVIDAARAHEEGIVQYESTGDVRFRHPTKGDLFIGADRQYPLIGATFDDLKKAVSSQSNSPRGKDGQTLNELVSKEAERYEDMVDETYDNGGWEPNYGSYVHDSLRNILCLVAPKKLHRLALVTSPSKLHTDPEGKLSWAESREIFDNHTVGYAGASVGGNIFEGVMRTVRPKAAKIADPDWTETTNLSRLNRGTIFDLVESRAARVDPRNPFETTRPNKAARAAYEQNMVDPFAEFYVYDKGLDADNVDQFLLGDEKNEPAIKLLIEEVDNLALKRLLKEKCREYDIPLLTIGDFGHRAHVQFKDFKRFPGLPLGYKVSDEEFIDRLEYARRSGDRASLPAFIQAACGPEYDADEFGMWMRGEGEQPTSSIPQLGSVAMATGGIGGEIVAMHALGHEIPELTVYDFKQQKVIEFTN